MKISLSVAIFLGYTSAIRLEKHRHHSHQPHRQHQKLSQIRNPYPDAWIEDCDPTRDVSAQTNPSGAGTENGKPLFGSYPGVGVECQGFAQRQSKDDAWIDDCAPGRNPFIAGNGNAGTVTSYPGVGIECQGFVQKKMKKHGLVQQSAGDDAWIDDCAPGRNPFIAGNGNAGTVTSYPGVGIECQGFSQKKKHSLAQNPEPDAWIDDCSPDRVMDGPYGSGTQGAPGANAKGSFDKVGVECQGFAQKKSQSLAQTRNPWPDAWIDDCDPARDPWALKNPSGAGTWDNEKNHGSFAGVGVECQGFAQKKSISMAQTKNPWPDAWIDDCDPERDPLALKNPSGAGTYEKSNNGSFPGVGVECQGFAQKKSISMAQTKNPWPDAWIDDCDPARDPLALKNPSGAGTYEEGQKGSFPGVGVECQGFAQRKSQSLAQGRNPWPDAWIDDCDPTRDVSAQTNPSGAGTENGEQHGSYPGVGVECQGFAQKKSHSLAQTGNPWPDAWIDACDPDRDVSSQSNPQGAGCNSYPGVGVECQGFAQKKSVSLAQKRSKDDAWIDDCAPGRNPFIAGNGNAGTVTSYPGVGIECQGFSQQKKKHSLAQNPVPDAWIEDCDPERDVTSPSNPHGAGSSTYPGVGVECQGFAQVSKKNKKHHFLRKQSKDCTEDMPDCNGTNGTPGVDCCDE